MANLKIDFLNKRMAQIVRTLKYKITGKGEDEPQEDKK